MQLSLKTKLILTTAVLMLAVVVAITCVYVASLTAQVFRQANEAAQLIAGQVLRLAEQALAEAAKHGAAPASLDPADLREYVRTALADSPGLNNLVETVMALSPNTYEISVSDLKGAVLYSSDVNLETVPERPAFDTLVRGGFVEQFRALFGPPRVYEVSIPFKLGQEPFGKVHESLSTVLLRSQIYPGLHRAALLGVAAVLLSTLLAALVTRAALAPLARITAQLDRISQGEFDLPPVVRTDELGQVSSKISQIGQQLRGVRQIFSNLRENLNQILAGLEDGLLLFTGDGRAVLVSASAEKFLGEPADGLLGRHVSEIFPRGHPLREALRIEGDRLEPVDRAEVQVNGAGGLHRVGASVQVIAEGGTRMGALVTLRDLESFERLSSQLQVSERLAALSKITAGVAHEVKNPLNTMRLWLENLKENLPASQELPQQAVKVLDNEIDRLDRVVKTFLDFTRPVELRLEPTNLRELLEGVLALAQPQIDKTHVVVDTSFPVDPVLVRADGALLQRAVFNLVLNACEAMKDGGRLHLAVQHRGEMAELRVTDTGPGIPPEHHGKIFELFFTTRPGGTGIGLATAFRIVQLHNGSIDFQSEPGQGSTFRIDLPVAT
jgi:PAS domain S-box-containing protein